MRKAKATAPEFQVETESAADHAIALRARLKAVVGDAPVSTFNDLMLKACAFAPARASTGHGSYADGRFVLPRGQPWGSPWRRGTC